MTPKTLDFSKVEALRQHMLLTIGQMAQLMGVSRMTYYNWLSGKPATKTNGDTARQVIRNLIAVMNEHQWPNEEAMSLSPKKRHERLLALLAER